MRGLSLWGGVVLSASSVRWKREVEERAGLEAEQGVQKRTGRHDRRHDGALVREHGSGAQTGGVRAVAMCLALSMAMVVCKAQVQVPGLPLSVVMVHQRTHRRQHHDRDHGDK